ncbi:hypothetical protein RR46_07779 [Papilio xuthus]|uniref:Uncharacterized protein n=1 Tax=Papilio xuthus TaxID=66420 RepID=A0A194QGD7_PAPXU|nr:hypothetical protein RR46_07779 [Papilio xuthus]
MCVLRGPPLASAVSIGRKHCVAGVATAAQFESFQT